ncbi:velvet factor, partial [Thamnocephalis sphaerospora]
MYAAVVAPDNLKEINFVNQHRTTAGTIVQSLFRLKDTENMDGGYFVFPDISVRIEGVFRLRFTLYEISGQRVKDMGTAYSEPFRVYSAKQFPGMAESTCMTRAFSDQGVRIRIRKESRLSM